MFVLSHPVPNIQRKINDLNNKTRISWVESDRCDDTARGDMRIDKTEKYGEKKCSSLRKQLSIINSGLVFNKSNHINFYRQKGVGIIYSYRCAGFVPLTSHPVSLL